MICTRICILLIAVIQLTFAKYEKYCSGPCERGRRHIACGNTGQFGPACNQPQLVDLKKHQNEILNIHNNCRNMIAKGGYQNYHPATRMAKMLWDSELAEFAKMNAMECVMRHDECHSTKKYHYPGQNIANQMWYGVNKTDSELIFEMTGGWFKEYELCSPSIIRSYPSGAPCGHFTAMLQERSDRVGCALVKHIFQKYFSALLVCNYALSNMLGEPVYTEGATASECVTGTDPKYTALCSVRETYELPFY